jgi:hypothetical protein
MLIKIRSKLFSKLLKIVVFIFATAYYSADSLIALHPVSVTTRSLSIGAVCYLKAPFSKALLMVRFSVTSCETISYCLTRLRHSIGPAEFFFVTLLLAIRITQIL